MKFTDCYHCERDASEFFDEENGYTLVRCTLCGLLYVSPRPEDDSRSEAVRTGFHTGDRNLNVNARWNESKLIQYHRVLNEILSGVKRLEIRSALDIGCGYGEFMFALKDGLTKRAAIIGFEPNEFKRLAAINFGLDVLQSLNDAAHKKFDMISLLNVYSHLSNPREDFRRYHQMLQPQGFLLIQTGDASGLSSAEMPKPYFLPDHLSFAGEVIIRNILEQAGFSVLKVCRYPSVNFSVLQCMKEIIKILIPGKRSNLRAILNHRNYAQRDMYILAQKRVSLND